MTRVVHELFILYDRKEKGYFTSDQATTFIVEFLNFRVNYQETATFFELNKRLFLNRIKPADIAEALLYCILLFLMVVRTKSLQADTIITIVNS